jgi:hypothetical protein
MNIRTQLVEHRVSGEKLLARVREVIHEGNVRRIIIKNQDGMTVMEVPLSVGVAGAVLLPIWVAVGAIAALAADYRLTVERSTEPVKHVEEKKIMPEPAVGGIAEPW